MHIRKIAIVGPGESGKTTCAIVLKQCTRLRFVHDTSEIAAALMFQHYKDIGLPYSTIEACHAERRKNRVEWGRVIEEYNKDDGAKLYRPAMSSLHGGYQDVLCGVRRKHEFTSCRIASLFDLAIWIQRDECPPDPSLELTAQDCDLSLTNNGSSQEFTSKIAHLTHWLGINNVSSGINGWGSKGSPSDSEG